MLHISGFLHCSQQSLHVAPKIESVRTSDISIENGRTCCPIAVQHLLPVFRSSRDVLGEVREAGVSE
jgi:hypothetical protein